MTEKQYAFFMDILEQLGQVQTMIDPINPHEEQIDAGAALGILCYSREVFTRYFNQEIAKARKAQKGV